MVGMRKAGALALFLPFAVPATAQPPEGRPVPPFSLPTLDGGTVSVKVQRGKGTKKSSLVVLLRKKERGKWVERRLKAKALLVIHWASWSPLSLRLLRRFAPMCEKFAKRGLVVVAINLFAAEGERKVGKLTKGMPYIVALDVVGLTTRSYRVSEVPVTTLVDARGIVRLTRTKCYPGILDEFRKRLSDLLGPSPKASSLRSSSCSQ
ncbi:MAG TPA: redoxin domain-containing protein [Armatimonadetes bacterium]|nr:redoxin domain-containing protein [Armatimonadota bacterium]